MIERLTYILGVAVAVISWGIGQLVADLTAVPVLYNHSATTAAEGKPSHTELELWNLSRSKAILNLKVDVRAQPAVSCTVTADKISPRGAEWTSEAAPDNTFVMLPSLMPGSQLFVRVEHARECVVRFSFGVDRAAPIRIIGSGVESFLLFHWLLLIVGLLAGGVVAFAIALVQAYRLSRAEAEAARAEAEAAHAVAEEARAAALAAATVTPGAAAGGTYTGSRGIIEG